MSADVRICLQCPLPDCEYDPTRRNCPVKEKITYLKKIKGHRPKIQNKDTANIEFKPQIGELINANT